MLEGRGGREGRTPRERSAVNGEGGQVRTGWMGGVDEVKQLNMHYFLHSNYLHCCRLYIIKLCVRVCSCQPSSHFNRTHSYLNETPVRGEVTPRARVDSDVTGCIFSHAIRTQVCSCFSTACQTGPRHTHTHTLSTSLAHAVPLPGL